MYFHLLLPPPSSPRHVYLTLITYVYSCLKIILKRENKNGRISLKKGEWTTTKKMVNKLFLPYSYKQKLYSIISGITIGIIMTMTMTMTIAIGIGIGNRISRVGSWTTLLSL